MVRIKHRYLLVNILYPDEKVSNGTTAQSLKNDVPYTVQFRQPSPDSLNSKILLRLVRDGVANLFGDYGSGMIAGSLQVKYFSPATSTVIIRVAREHFRLVWAALTFTTSLPYPVDRSCVMQVVRVSGTIKKAEEEAIRRAKVAIKRARAGADVREKPAEVISSPKDAVAADCHDGSSVMDDVMDLDASEGSDDELEDD